MLGFNFNLKDQLVFYGSYHHNPINQAIHFVFVPLILWTVAVWLAYTPPVFNLDVSSSTWIPSCCAEYIVFNGSFILLSLYSLYYITLEAFAGITWAIFVSLPFWITSVAFQQHCPAHAWIWALGLHILSWVMQVYFGHVVAEKRKPALLDSFFQSLVLAPLFVWFELLFLLGYRKELYAEVNREVTRNIAEWKQQTAALLTSSSRTNNNADADDDE